MQERVGLAWTALAGLFLLVVWWGPTPALRRPLGVIVLPALAAIGFELLRRIAVAEHTDHGTHQDVPSQSSAELTPK